MISIGNYVSPIHRETYCCTPFCMSVCLSVCLDFTNLSTQLLLHFSTDLDETWHTARWLCLDMHEVTIFRFVNLCKSYGPWHLDLFTLFTCQRNSSYISRQIWMKLGTKQVKMMMPRCTRREDFPVMVRLFHARYLRFYQFQTMDHVQTFNVWMEDRVMRATICRHAPVLAASWDPTAKLVRSVFTIIVLFTIATASLLLNNYKTTWPITNSFGTTIYTSLFIINLKYQNNLIIIVYFRPFSNFE
jgi:hypothetical protein